MHPACLHVFVSRVAAAVKGGGARLAAGAAVASAVQESASAGVPQRQLSWAATRTVDPRLQPSTRARGCCKESRSLIPGVCAGQQRC
eukprot:228077-Chlamydomonas_euryale.AAC.1